MDRVHAELGAAGVFVCVAKARELDELLPRWMRTTRRRITQADRLGAPIPPKLNWVARGARVAVLPEFGTVWVDDEHLFRPGELVPLPWTDPLVELTVVRPAAVLVAMRDILGPGGPKRAKLRET